MVHKIVEQLRLRPQAMYNAKERDKLRADEKREALRKYLVEKGCVDCGYNHHHAALEFDHLPGYTKIKNVMAMTYNSWEVIWAEVEKCEVVCANCHAIRTHERRLDKVANAMI
ncbi:HNH endonuclease [Streptomyces phage MeganTheeKilla]|uniref:HNH endonuclease n=1 Tax=Streptomyces phage MeganTheeKilla TaxID=2801897 RepID=A0A7U0J6M9_9CAUD|nr:HNH endonuclease [Streptomyces phage MeganTheeKilla]